MKPLQLDADTAKRFWEMYQAAFPNMADANRNLQTFQAVCYDRNTQIFHGPGDTIILLTEVNIPPHTAALHILADTAAVFRHREKFWDTFKELMELFYLQKLSVFIPSPAKTVCKLYRLLGFLHEGTLRSSVLMDGELVDAEIYGVLRSELEDETVAKRNRVRKKKKPSLVERAGLKAS